MSFKTGMTVNLLTNSFENRMTNIRRYVEMMAFLPLGNFWSHRFQGASGNSILSAREVDQGEPNPSSMPVECFSQDSGKY